MPVVVVSAGHELAVGRIAEAERPQAELKAGLIARSFGRVGVDAMALGGSDWGLGREVLFGLIADNELPIVAANLVCDGQHPFPGYRLIEGGGVRIGVVGVTEGVSSPDCSEQPALPALRKALGQLGEVDFSVALLPFRGRGQLAQFTSAELGVDLVLDAMAGKVDKTPRSLGDLQLISAGSRGKHLGIAELAVTPGAHGVVSSKAPEEIAQRRARVDKQLASVRTRIAQAPSDAALKQLKAQERSYLTQQQQLDAELATHQARTKTAHPIRLRPAPIEEALAEHAETQADVDATLAAINKLEGGAPDAVVRTVVRRAEPGSVYAGAEACVSCHRAQFLQWSTTPHARAYVSLAKAKRSMDRACWSCHVTGAGKPGGPAGPAQVGGLHDVQCEACHGPSRAHVEAPKQAASMPQPGSEVEVCTGCHDGERDGGRFDARRYLPRVVHTKKAIP